ncbi:exonuclease subunit SbcD [Alcaligenaceae bacterium 429]|nr:exonuclease subunit SbcD [Alcaligenaceae bacterium 429]
MSSTPLTILHTSDWHLGRSLYGKKRYQEFEDFLNWMLTQLHEQQVDVLLIAGDVFDTTTPSNKAQELYYHFLQQVAQSPCQHVVIIAGNHDSPSFLEAPKTLLKALQIHVVGSPSANIEDDVLVLYDAQQQAELIVCAVPYLRDKDIRTTQAGESPEEKNQHLLQNIHAHYHAIAERAEQLQAQHASHPPIIATGHLFATGGQTIDGDGVRELYVGSLNRVPAAAFSPAFSYVALGHLHVPQMVDQNPNIRYSGSPLPMGFGEARQQKSLCIVQLLAGQATVSLLPIPVFQKLVSIRGDWPHIHNALQQLTPSELPVWVEVIYDGDELISNLRERIDHAIEGSAVDVLRVQNQRVIERLLQRTHQTETLEEMSVTEVFERCLTAHEIPEEQRPLLREHYQHIVQSLEENDNHSA